MTLKHFPKLKPAGKKFLGLADQTGKTLDDLTLFGRLYVYVLCFFFSDWLKLVQGDTAKFLLYQPQVYPKLLWRRIFWQIRCIFFYRLRILYRLNFTDYYEKHNEFFVRGAPQWDPVVLPKWQWALNFAFTAMFIALVGNLSALAFPIVIGTNYYVRKAGNNGSAGTSPSTAKLTIAGGISASVLADHVYVGAGVYRESALNSTRQLHGDVTGANTGDAGEVIISGLDSNDSAPSSVQNILAGGDSSGSTVNEKFIISDFKLSKGGFGQAYVLAAIANSFITYQDLVIKNFRCDGTGDVNGNNYILFENNTGSTFGSNVVQRVYCEEFLVQSAGNTNVYLRGFSWSTKGHSMYNVEMANMKAIQSDNSSFASGAIHGYEDSTGGSNPGANANLYFHHFVACGQTGVTIHGMDTVMDLKNSCFEDFFGSSPSTSNNIFDIRGISTSGTITITNCAINTGTFKYLGGGNTQNNVTATTGTVTNTGGLTKGFQSIRSASKISRFSVLLGAGTSGGASDDIFGNPRPAYSSTNGNVGAAENTFDDIQKESTVHDAGSFSGRFQPCNNIKRVFQIPVVNATARTVTIKCRIDGTWGSLRPKFSLSYAGTTVTATKNSTTGSFETLTLTLTSGNVTSDGLATLTVEMHETSTDAIAYIDTLALS